MKSLFCMILFSFRPYLLMVVTFLPLNIFLTILIQIYLPKKEEYPVTDRPAVDFQSGFLPRQALLHGIQKSVFDPVPPSNKLANFLKFTDFLSFAERIYSDLKDQSKTL